MRPSFCSITIQAEVCARRDVQKGSITAIIRNNEKRLPAVAIRLA